MQASAIKIKLLRTFNKNIFEPFFPRLRRSFDRSYDYTSLHFSKPLVSAECWYTMIVHPREYQNQPWASRKNSKFCH